MTKNINTDINAGVHTNIGMDFQKYCTVFLFLEKYEKIKDSKYFIILEHNEDITFGFLNYSDELANIETYQAKKSTNAWTLNGLLEIIKKITITSQRILDDNHQKSKSFFQQNYFATNNTINLKCFINKKSVTKKINETNHTLSYSELEQEMKDKISNGNKDVIFDKINISNLNTLYFRYIDLSRTSRSQLDQLKGRFQTVFGDQIIDHKAALDTFLDSLRDIESTFNQNNIASLNDKSKRIESQAINRILNILTTKKLAFTFWRKKSDDLCEELNVSILESNTFKLHYENSFDDFKDLHASEHRKIYTFVKENKAILGHCYSDIDCILSFLNEFNKNRTSTLGDLQLKAVMSAAYIEVKNTL